MDGEPGLSQLKTPSPLGTLRYSNPSGDPAKAPRCGAKARTRGGLPCQAPAIAGKLRCRMHGGVSTGPRTPEGLERSRRARWIHGKRSMEARAARVAERERETLAREARAIAESFIARSLRRR